MTVERNDRIPAELVSAWRRCMVMDSLELGKSQLFWTIFLSKLIRHPIARYVQYFVSQFTKFVEDDRVKWLPLCQYEHRGI